MKKGMIITGCLLIVLLALLFSGCTNDNGDNGDDDEPTYLTINEIYDKNLNDEFKPNETVIAKDEIVDIWYNATTDYTYYLFKSMDEKVEFEWGYDVGHPGDDTDEFSTGDTLIMTMKFTDQVHPDGGLIGHFVSIELAD